MSVEKRWKPLILVALASLILILGACGNTKSTNPDNKENTEATGNMDGMDHGSMNHSGSGEIPEGLRAAENPTYAVRNQAIMESDHMPGMKGAKATIVGAYDTAVYTISYTPTSGGPEVKDHKWVIHEELKDAGKEPLEPGVEAVVNADHMEGMKGATAVIASAEQTTVYMVDFTTTTGEEVKNHKWVTESELAPVQ